MKKDARIGTEEVTNNCRSVSVQQSSATRVNPSRACLIGQAHVSREKLDTQHDTQQCWCPLIPPRARLA